MLRYTYIACPVANFMTYQLVGVYEKTTLNWTLYVGKRIYLVQNRVKWRSLVDTTTRICIS
jgi:hypothetical protein